MHQTKTPQAKCVSNSASQQRSGSPKAWVETQGQVPLLDKMHQRPYGPEYFWQETLPLCGKQVPPGSPTLTVWASLVVRGHLVVLKELKLTWIVFCAFLSRARDSPSRRRLSSLLKLITGLAQNHSLNHSQSQNPRGRRRYKAWGHAGPPVPLSWRAEAAGNPTSAPVWMPHPGPFAQVHSIAGIFVKRRYENF